MKNKLERYTYNKNSRYVIEKGKEIFKSTKGKWHQIFGNKNRIVLELACGNGEYTVHESLKNKNKNFIGIDIKGSRIWKGANSLEKENSGNAIFLRIAIENILDFFEKDEVSEIMIIFPDPRHKKRDEKKRLSNIHFLKKYYEILRSKGKLKFKTDDTQLFEYSLNEIRLSKFKNLKKTDNLYNTLGFDMIKNVQTKYEKKFLKEGRIIKYFEVSK